MFNNFTKILFIHGSTVRHIYGPFRESDPIWGFATALEDANSNPENLLNIEVFCWGPKARIIKWWQALNLFL